MTDVAEIAAAAYDAGRSAGYRDALVDVAVRVVEIDDAWRGGGRIHHEQRVAQRLALYERCAQQIAEKLGRPYTNYTGGPVDWETGRPARQMEAAA